MTTTELKTTTTTVLNTLCSDPEKLQQTILHFMGKVDKNGPIPDRCPELGPCWLWKGGTDGKLDPYGKYNMGGTILRSHRVAYVLFCESIPEGAHIDHLCGNRLCINPTHLETVTTRENNRRARAYAAKNSPKRKRLPTDPVNREQRFYDAVSYEIDGLTRSKIQEKTGQQDKTVGLNRKAVKSHPYIGPLVEETIKQNEQAALDDAAYALRLDAWKTDPAPQLERRAEYLSQKAHHYSPSKEQHEHDQ